MTQHTPLRVVGGGCPFRSTQTRQHQGWASQGPGGGEGGVPSHPTVPEGRASRDNILPKVPGVLPCVLAVTHLCQVLSLAGGHWAEIYLHCPAPSLFFYNLTLLLGDLACIGRALDGSGPGLSSAVQLQPSVPLA